MNCERFQEKIIDILYGEASSPRENLEFFRHLTLCEQCEREYLELVETRERLSEWNPDNVPAESSGGEERIVSIRFRSDRYWWGLLQRVAAGVLILLGVFTIIQNLGLFGPPRTGMSEERLAEMVHDIIVARQVEDWKVIGSALLSLKEEVEAQNRLEMRSVYEDLYTLEQRYVHALEENNRQMETLLRR